MSAYTILGVILLGVVLIAALIAAFEKGPRTPKTITRGGGNERSYT